MRSFVCFILDRPEFWLVQYSQHFVGWRVGLQHYSVEIVVIVINVEKLTEELAKGAGS